MTASACATIWTKCVRSSAAFSRWRIDDAIAALSAVVPELAAAIASAARS